METDVGFTGTGWEANKAWLRAARASDPVEVTSLRADAIVLAAIAHNSRAGSFGPWMDNLDRVMLPGEHRWVFDLWVAGPGDRSFTDTLLRIRNG